MSAGVGNSSTSTKPKKLDNKVDKPKGIVEPTSPEVANKEPLQNFVTSDDPTEEPEEAHALSRENTKQFPADDLTDPSKVILGGLFDTVYSLSHIVGGLIFAYFVGWLGFHISWVLFSIFVIWVVDRKYKQDGWNRRFQFFLLEEKKRQVVAAEKESAEWLNLALEKFFPIYSPQISDSVEASIIAAIEAAMAVPPPPITHVSVQGCDLGVNPPSLHMIKTFNLPGHEWQMDATLKYHGDIRIVVAAGIGLKALSINLPIAIQNFVLEGRVRIHMSMASTPPFYKTMKVKRINKNEKKFDFLIFEIKKRLVLNHRRKSQLESHH